MGGVLAETKQLLVDKHKFAPEAQQAYVDKILCRFANPYQPDTVDRSAGNRCANSPATNG